MATNYRATKPVQQFDPTSCWAAALEWWARAIGNRTVIKQLDLLNVYLSYWDASNPETNPELWHRLTRQPDRDHPRRPLENGL